MTRSAWKGPFVHPALLKKIDRVKRGLAKPSELLKCWARSSTITPDAVGLTFGIYNGKKFVPVAVHESMIGHKFGEFSPTRVVDVKHPGRVAARSVKDAKGKR